MQQRSNQVRLAELRHSNAHTYTHCSAIVLGQSQCHECERSVEKPLFFSILALSACVCVILHLFSILIYARKCRVCKITLALNSWHLAWVPNSMISSPRSLRQRAKQYAQPPPFEYWSCACIDNVVFRKKRAWPPWNWPNCPLKWHRLIYPR